MRSIRKLDHRSVVSFTQLEGSVVAVVSGAGGTGASTFAALLACRSAGESVLVDCDEIGGGIDVLLGCEEIAGPRWSQVRLTGHVLDPSALLEGLPRWHRVAYLAADGAAVDTDHVLQVVDSARQAAFVVLDVPRWPSPLRAACLAIADRVVVLMPSGVRGLVGSAQLWRHVPQDMTVAVLRQRRATHEGADIDTLLAVPVVGTFSDDHALRGPTMHPGGVRRRTWHLVDAVLETLTYSQATV